MGAIAGRDYDVSADAGGGIITEYGTGARGGGIMMRRRMWGAGL